MQQPEEDLAWLNAAPVDREFGSPDYERLMAFDQAAFAALHSWGRIRQWLATRTPQLNGACPDGVARNPDGLSKAWLLVHCLKQFTRYLLTLHTLVDQQRSLYCSSRAFLRSDRTQSRS